MLKVEKVTNSDSWKTVFYTAGGSVVFHSNGTVSTHGLPSVAEMAEVFAIFESPRGVDWWRLFAVDQLSTRGSQVEARQLAERLGMGNTLPGIACNNPLMSWIRSTRLHEKLSVDAFSQAKATLWDSDRNEPRVDLTADTVLAYIHASDKVSRKSLISFIESIR